jgi:predicted metalloprotease with PDZ domain
MAGPGRPIVIAAFITICGSFRASAQPAMTLNVDASQARMKILHASLSMPARSGAVTLVYPKWIPGEHMPSGPISNLTGLHIFADGAELMWRRDLLNMNAFHLTVPAGARTLTATYDYVVPTGGGAFGTTASANAKCAVINWNTIVLSPEGENPDAIRVTASLKLPAGWKASRRARRLASRR